MPKADPKVMTLVENALAKDPDATVTDLYEKAKAAHPSVGKLTHRQFNARYPLQVKRKKSLKSGKRRSRRRSRGRTSKGKVDGAQREKIRAAFLDFASDLAAAQERSDLVNVVAGVDAYVDRVVKVL